MSSAPLDSIGHRLIGVGAVLLLGIGHGVHDLIDGDSVVVAFLPAVLIVLYVTAMSAGQGIARRRSWSRRVVLSLAILASMVFGFMIVVAHLEPPGMWVQRSQSAMAVDITHLGIGVAIVGVGILGFWFLVFYLPAALSEARTRALAAESGLRKAELARLRSNLQPHFLLNTLNAVAGLLVAEPRQARQLVSALGDLLRDSLEEGGEMRTLEEEVEWLRRYAEIFEIRHRGAIHFAWDLSPDTLATPIPRLLLQPLLENAIEHGALRHPGGGTVTLRSQTTGMMIQCSVSDDGPGMESPRSDGLGLRLVQDRLQLAYPAARMVVDSTGAGTCVTLELPKTERTG